MALELRESNWMEQYRAATKRRRADAWRRLNLLSIDLRGPLDALVTLGMILGSAVVLAWMFPN